MMDVSAVHVDSKEFNPHKYWSIEPRGRLGVVRDVLV